MGPARYTHPIVARRPHWRAHRQPARAGRPDRAPLL